jgi:hypothetical protein
MMMEVFINDKEIDDRSDSDANNNDNRVDGDSCC